MNRSVVQTLILKDLRLQREGILISMAAGGLGLALLELKSETAFMIGGVWFFVSLIVLGCMLPGTNVINERKKQNLAFLMSLPVSAMQYATAKLVSTIGLFLVPWATLVIAALTFILSRRDIPNGLIPVTLILAGLTLVGFFLIAGVVLVSESEVGMIAVTIVCNSSYGLVWYFIVRLPAVYHGLSSRVPVWNSTVLSILGCEVGASALILGLTFCLQSRKRSFV